MKRPPSKAYLEAAALLQHRREWYFYLRDTWVARNPEGTPAEYLKVCVGIARMLLLTGEK